MGAEPLNAVGQSYRDFLITKYLPLEELQSTLVELVHEPSGAQVMHIANSDPENLFCLGFQTIPDSSNGVAHILEHTTLCGSKKFPVKDPFFAMTRRSLNTFMNAMTGQDFTCYPAASQVKKDFYHLLDVYIDAVFRPELKQVSFWQEGHRLELSKSELRFQGVVYNEMKGAMSSSESRLWEAVCKHLTPDLPYALNSGGDPQAIPSLCYEDLVEFHRSFYHPSRCLFFFYGNLPLAGHLNFIDEHALQGVEKIPPLPPLPKQVRFSKPLTVTESYPILDASGKKDIIALSWLTSPLSDQGEVLALTLLDSLLMDTDASPLKQPLLRSKLCQDVDSSIDTEMSEVPWSLVFRGCSIADAEKLEALTLKTLRTLAQAPFPKDEIEASLHQLEFHRKEIGAEGVPYGLTLFFRAAPLKQHGSQPEEGLMIHSLFSELRAKLKDPAYLNQLIQKHFLDNPHRLLVKLKADPHLEQKEQEEEQQRLKDIQKSLTEANKQRLLQQSQELAAYQASIEHQSLACLPKVTLADVPLHARNLPLSEIPAGPLRLFHHPCFTNKIVYADLILDLPDIAPADFPLLSFLTRILTELGAGGKTYEEMLSYQQAYVGAFDASLSLFISHENPDQLSPALSLRGKALLHNIDKLFSLFSAYLSSPDFTDETRIRELLSQHASDLENRLIKQALSYASASALSSFSQASYLHHEWNGIPYYRTIRSWQKSFPKTLLSDLERLKTPLLSSLNADLVLSCGEQEFETIRQQPLFDVPKRTAAPWKGNYPLPTAQSIAHPIAAPVSFTAWGLRTASFCDPAAPALLIATELLDNCVLHREIREKGGAYGGSASYAPATGNFYLYSYRDPHLAQTIAIFQRALETIAAGQFNDRELEEAKLGVFQSLDTPTPPHARAALAYSWKRTGRTMERRERLRQAIRDANKEDITSALSPLLSQKKTTVSFVGAELFHREKADSLTFLEI